MRNFARLSIDLVWVAFSGFLALIIRDNLIPSIPRLQAIVPYAVISVAVAAMVFSVARLNRTVWRYTSLLDALHIMGAITVVLLLALLGGFALNRLENVARSVPVIQWFVLVAAMIGTRIGARVWQERAGKNCQTVNAPAPVQHVLLIGLNDLTELYLASITEFAPPDFAVVGILSRGRGVKGRSIRQYEILGSPEEISRVLAELELHGVTVDRIVVLQSFDQLSPTAQQALSEVERTSAITVEWLLETLGWGEPRGPLGPKVVQEIELPSSTGADNVRSSPRRGYAGMKRAIDLVAAIGFVLALWPVVAMVALIVAVDVGLPVVFWQQRPGRSGRPFKLFKFRTMQPAHDVEGNRIPDELRSSSIGRFLRRSRLDELPQLYNIFVGEMSFVGPRPLLPLDQPKGHHARLLVRPGLTGWAQINGGREISNDDKAALDSWYIMNASLRLDITILLRTLGILLSGDRINGVAVIAAHASLEETRPKPALGAACSALTRAQSSSAHEAA